MTIVKVAETPRTWKVSDVKAEMPDLIVRIDGKEYRARITGRALTYPVITVNCGCVWCRKGHTHSWETNWTSLVHILNEKGGVITL